MKQKSIKDTTISWDERTSSGTIQPKSFMCPQEHSNWHVQQMKKSPGVLSNIKINGKGV